MTSQLDNKYREFLNISRLDKQIREAMVAHNIQVDSLNIEQTMEAFKQALASGDFCRHVTVNDGGQTVTYEPYRLEELLRRKIIKLKIKLESIQDILTEE